VSNPIDESSLEPATEHGTTRLPKEVFLTHPANFFALGAGSGLAPVAPGTFGTLAAVPIAWFLPQSTLIYAMILLASFAIGVWFCDHCTADLGMHDHGGIVWDEWVGYFIALFALPRTWVVLLAAFILFRIFDVFKPWPIGPVDKRVPGGLGIMIDDVIAGLMTCAVLHLVFYMGWFPSF